MATSSARCRPPVSIPICSCAAFRARITTHSWKMTTALWPTRWRKGPIRRGRPLRSSLPWLPWPMSRLMSTPPFIAPVIWISAGASFTAGNRVAMARSTCHAPWPKAAMCSFTMWPKRLGSTKSLTWARPWALASAMICRCRPSPKAFCPPKSGSSSVTNKTGALATRSTRRLGRDMSWPRLCNWLS